MKAQRDYWDAWSSFAAKLPETEFSAAAPRPPWVDMLEHWGKVLQPRSNGGPQEFFSRMLDQGKAFFQLSEELTRFLKSLTEVSKKNDGWQDMLRLQFGELKKAFAHVQTDPKAAMDGLSAFWNLPLDTWRRTASSASLLPGDFLQSMKPAAGWETVQERLHEGMERFLSVPGIGYTREAQEEAQASMRLWIDYQRAMQEYVNAHSRLGVDTLDRLLEKIIEKAERGEQITNLRQVYDLWVDCGEQAYNDFVFTEQYAELYADMVNAVMALKHQGQAMVDEAFAALGMPTRRGFDTIQCRQQELRREIVALKASRGTDKDAIDRLREELAELRNDLVSLKASVAPVGSVATATAEANPVGGKKKSGVTKQKASARAAPRTRKKTAGRRAS